MNILIDSWGWIALADQRDTYHKEVVVTYQNSILATKNTLITTDYIVAETLTALRSCIGHEKSVQWLSMIQDEVLRGTLGLIHINQKLWTESTELLRKYSDKPDISFTDFTSFVVMKELKISHVFTGDRHFEQVNMGFQLIK